MRSIKIVGLAVLTVLALSAVAVSQASAAVANLGPAENEKYGAGFFGAFEPKEEREFQVINATPEEVTVEEVKVENPIAPMALKIVAAVGKPECKKGLKLAVGKLCFSRLRNEAAKKGGMGLYVIQAKGAKKWKTEIEAF